MLSSLTECALTRSASQSLSGQFKATAANDNLVVSGYCIGFHWPFGGFISVESSYWGLYLSFLMTSRQLFQRWVVRRWVIPHQEFDQWEQFLLGIATALTRKGAAAHRTVESIVSMDCGTPLLLSLTNKLHRKPGENVVFAVAMMCAVSTVFDGRRIRIFLNPLVQGFVRLPLIVYRWRVHKAINWSASLRVVPSASVPLYRGVFFFMSGRNSESKRLTVLYLPLGQDSPNPSTEGCS